MFPVAAFPELAKPITMPVGALAASTVVQAELGQADYAVIEPVGDGVRVRAASVDEQLVYEQQRGLGCVTRSVEEFFAELESPDKGVPTFDRLTRCSSASIDRCPWSSEGGFASR